MSVSVSVSDLGFALKFGGLSKLFFSQNLKGYSREVLGGLGVLGGFPDYTGVLKCTIMTKHIVLTQSKPPFIPQDP